MIDCDLQRLYSIDAIVGSSFLQCNVNVFVLIESVYCVMLLVGSSSEGLAMREVYGLV